MTHVSVPPRSISLFTALLMAWTAIYCCCRSAPAATHGRSCCVERRVDAAKHCPPGPAGDDCPVLQVRQHSVVATPLPPAASVAILALPTWLTPILPLPTAADAPAAGRVEAATGPPTLLALHTLLLT